jgi:hypothetical protein
MAQLERVFCTSEGRLLLCPFVFAVGRRYVGKHSSFGEYIGSFQRSFV